MRFIKLFLVIASLLIAGITACDQSDDDNGSPGGNGNDNGHENRKGTGESAEALLKADDYSQLQVEIQYVEGFKPTNEALDNFKTFLNDRLHKPDGIEFYTTKLPKPGQAQYALEDITNIEDSSRAVYNTEDEMGLYFLFLDGEYEPNSNTLGIAYWNTSMVIFEEKLQEISGGLDGPDQSVVETAVINHEMGHNLGLVANGSPMQNNHQDEANGHHCDNENCLMYYAIETGDIISNFLGDSAPALDQNCKDDLKANGGK